MMIKELNEEVGEDAIKALLHNKPVDLEIKSLWTAYETARYSGYGFAVYLDSKGGYHYDDLGHCSCYGPFDGGWNRITYTKGQVIKLLQHEMDRGLSDSRMAKLLLEELV